MPRAARRCSTRKTATARWPISTRRRRDAAAYDIRGNAKKYLGDLDGSIADDTMAIRLAPKLGLYYGNRAISYSEKGDAARALADFNRDVEIEPTVAAAFNNRGQFFLQRKD